MFPRDMLLLYSRGLGSRLECLDVLNIRRLELFTDSQLQLLEVLYPAEKAAAMLLTG